MIERSVTAVGVGVSRQQHLDLIIGHIDTHPGVIADPADLRRRPGGGRVEIKYMYLAIALRKAESKRSQHLLEHLAACHGLAVLVVKIGGVDI